VIDLRAARANPEPVRAALARKGAGDAFDRLLEADERWRALVPRVDELRAKTKLKGKPTPEQLGQLQAVKAALKSAEDELAAAEAERDTLALRVPGAQLACEAPMACGYGACYGCVVPRDGSFVRLCIEGPVLLAGAA